MENLIFLVMLLIATSLLIAKVSHFDILSPGWLTICVFTCSAVIVTLNFSFFNEDLSLKTVFCIYLYLVLLFAGERISSNSSRPRLTLRKTQLICIPTKKVLICTILVLGGTYIQYSQFMSIANYYGAGDIQSAFIINRVSMIDASNGGDLIVQTSRMQSLLLTVSSLLYYYFIYCFLFNKIFHKKTQILYLLPAVAFFPSLFFVTGRAAFISPIVHIIVVSIVMLAQMGTLTLKLKKKVIKTILFCICGFICFFVLFAIFQSSDNSIGPIFDYLSLYLGSPIICFNHFLNTDTVLSEHLGQITFEGIYNNLRTLGFDIEYFPRHLENYYFNNGSVGSNVFTGFYGPVKDFGVFFGGLLIFIIGLINGAIISRLKNNVFDPRNFIWYYVASRLSTSAIMLFFNYQYYTFFSSSIIIAIFFVIIIQSFLPSDKNQYADF